ncbi:MAG: hypothetical protein CMH54_08015 [Myxococcales bacterium]|nr:hypothetical protein [Myxococcales bacterium]
MEEHSESTPAQEERSRDRWQPVEDLIERLPLVHGMIFADIGTGSGHFAVPVGQLLRGTGTVFSVDCDGDGVEGLKNRLETEDLTGWVIPMRVESNTFPLPDNSVDLASLGDEVHAGADAAAVMAEIRRVLRPNGRLVVIGWKQDESQDPIAVAPPVDARLSAEQTREVVTAAGFAYQESWDIYPSHNVLVFGESTAE